MRSFILIAFKYPPYSGVGGFRWAKLCKYLAKLGHKIHVITVNWEKTSENTLIDDVSHPNINIYRIASGYLHNLKFLKFKNLFFNKIKKKSFNFFDKNFYYDDYAQHWNIFVIPFCKKLIKQTNTEVIIATGHPFQSMRWASEIKQKTKNVKIIQDFRDPWIHPYKKFLSSKNIQKIEGWVQFSLEHADHCVFVTNGLVELMIKLIECPYSVITNGHDIDFFEDEIDKREQWIYAGNLAYGREVMAKCFLDVVQEDAELLKKCIVKLYGKTPEFIINEYPQLIDKKIINILGIASQEKVIRELKRSRIALHFGSEKFPYALSTKIFENAAAGIPTLSINGGGEIEDLIENNNWGVSVRPVFADIKEGIKKISDFGCKIRRDTVEQYHYKNLSYQYSELINGI